jgi:hypothetical protein
MGALPKLTFAPRPDKLSAMRDFMKPHVMPFIQAEDVEDIGWIHIIDPTQIVTNTNIAAGTMTVDVTPIWSGYARIKPIRNSVSTWRATNPTTTRIVQFWTEFPEDQTVDLKPGLRIAVEFGGTDPWLTEYLYTIVGAINGSASWQRTIDAQTDLENRPNYDMSAWPKPGE